jgi:hypothetical protein
MPDTEVPNTAVPNTAVKGQDHGDRQCRSARPLP